MPHHFEILRNVPGGRLRIVECVREADAFDRRLGDSLDARRGFDAQYIENSRHHVDGMRVLGAHFTLRFDTFRPMDDARIADTAAISLALPAAERCVAGPCPAPGVVVTKFRAAKLVQSG